jgi:hypothetical protein
MSLNQSSGDTTRYGGNIGEDMEFGVGEDEFEVGEDEFGVGEDGFDVGEDEFDVGEDIGFEVGENIASEGEFVKESTD